MSSAAAVVEVLSPEDQGEYVFVREPTRQKLASYYNSGTKTLYEVSEIIDDSIAFTNFAKYSSAVAFDRLPRSNIIFSWKMIGTKVLKTIRRRPGETAEYFRREAGFLAFQEGADGLWIPDMAQLPTNFAQALDEAKEDWRILLYLRELLDKAATSDDPLIRTDSRRGNYWLGNMPADWEDLDTLRLENVAWAKRLEQLLHLTEADLPVTPSKPIPEEPYLSPFAEYDEKPLDVPLVYISERKSVKLSDDVWFWTDYEFFEFTYIVRDGHKFKKDEWPGGELDLMLYVPSTNGVDYLPYNFHCDMDPMWSGPRAPAPGRSSFLFGTDERFRPYSIAYGAHNSKLRHYPLARTYGPDYPNTCASMKYEPLESGDGWRIKIDIKWEKMYGHWPTVRNGVHDIWYFGIKCSRTTGSPLLFRLIWPKGRDSEFDRIAERMDSRVISDRCQNQMEGIWNRWHRSFEERYYPFATTGKPSFIRYDKESDDIFMKRIVQPLLDENEPVWKLYKRAGKYDYPPVNRQDTAIKHVVWRKLERILYLSQEVSRKRRDYLCERFAGRMPPEYTPDARRTDTTHGVIPNKPDVDFDENELQLDDTEAYR